MTDIEKINLAEVIQDVRSAHRKLRGAWRQTNGIQAVYLSRMETKLEEILELSERVEL